ncbi:outer membrane protein with beta-barrel domain [Flavobacterium chryseum]|uniref:OmpA family protein n=1 Tax=Flavobacterium sp. P3160 TaxID=2512113 RepID=UPI00105E9374|nr:OmpA family protein [Flavobacterium sp. P3160]TDO73561.1 outer membrane protein with beta-barrel domain [Flavobacterium sp. P3160]
MKTNISFKTKIYSTKTSGKTLLNRFLLLIVLCLSAQATLHAQEVFYTKPSWFFGVAGATNYSFYRGSTHQLNSNITPPVTFHNGEGAGLYLAPLVEFHKPDTRLGFMFQAGYDSRKGSFDQKMTSCNCPADLSTDLSYITIEPSIRFAPFKSNFYLYGGPRLAFNVDKAFKYSLGTNPAYPDQEETADVRGDFDAINKTIISMQIGAGFDIPLSSQYHKTQFVLSPFINFQPYFGQHPRSTETWSVTALRVGMALKFGRGSAVETPVAAITPSKVQFSVNAPKNIPGERSVREVFPLRNYVFFDLNSNKIPSRYKLLKKEDVKDFDEDQIGVTASVNPSGRSRRQMTVYYNVINILGNRMVKNPGSNITLVGSSEKGTEDGTAMAESIKTYLVSVFQINAARITTKGQLKPTIPSEQPGATKELVLLREGDRRVSIESNSPELLMEFQVGPDASLKPLELVTVQEAPIDSYITIDAAGAGNAYSSWSLETTDPDGKVKAFGPYTQEKVSIPGKSIMGTRAEGDYKVKMIGKTKNGTIEEKVTTTHMVLWTPAKTDEGLRYSIIFEFNKSKAIAMYEKYLTDVVTPKIPKNAVVIIHGHTDIIGEESYNLNLSLDRANEVKSIIQNALSNSGRKDVKFEVHGFGEDESMSAFENKLPEERFYNRTVIIDIIPAAK